MGCSHSCGAHAITGSNSSCKCSFQKRLLLRCSYILRVYKSIKYNVSCLPRERWGYEGDHVSERSLSPQPTASIRDEYVPYVPKDKISLDADACQVIVVSSVSLDDAMFNCLLRQLPYIGKISGSGKDTKNYTYDRESNAQMDMDDAAEVNQPLGE